MSEAAKPQSEGDLFAYGAQTGNCLVYEGVMEGEKVTFYFNLENAKFLCTATVQGKSAKMAGDIITLGEGKVQAKPIWGVQPFGDSEEWVSTEGEEIKTFDISSNQLDFEGCMLNKVK